MPPTQSHELTELVADLAVLIEVVAPPHAPALSSTTPAAVALALDAFEGAWQLADARRPRGLGSLGERVAAAGMAVLEGDPVTARRLVGVEPPARRPA